MLMGAKYTNITVKCASIFCALCFFVCYTICSMGNVTILMDFIVAFGHVFGHFTTEHTHVMLVSGMYLHVLSNYLLSQV